MMKLSFEHRYGLTHSVETALEWKARFARFNEQAFHEWEFYFNEEKLDRPNDERVLFSMRCPSVTLSYLILPAKDHHGLPRNMWKVEENGEASFYERDRDAEQKMATILEKHLSTLDAILEHQLAWELASTVSKELFVWHTIAYFNNARHAVSSAADLHRYRRAQLTLAALNGPQAYGQQLTSSDRQFLKRDYGSTFFRLARQPFNSSLILMNLLITVVTLLQGKIPYVSLPAMLLLVLGQLVLTPQPTKELKAFYSQALKSPSGSSKAHLAKSASGSLPVG